MVNHYYYSNIYIINFNTYFVFLSIQDFEVVDNEENAEWEKEIEDMLEEEDNK